MNKFIPLAVVRDAAQRRARKARTKKGLTPKQCREIIAAICELSAQTHFDRPYRDRTSTKIKYIQQRLTVLREQLNKG